MFLLLVVEPAVYQFFCSFQVVLHLFGTGLKREDEEESQITIGQTKR